MQNSLTVYSPRTESLSVSSGIYPFALSSVEGLRTFSHSLAELQSSIAPAFRSLHEQLLVTARVVGELLGELHPAGNDFELAGIAFGTDPRPHGLAPAACEQALAFVGKNMVDE